jgi:plasmid maintenance system antidote protein VapI
MGNSYLTGEAQVVFKTVDNTPECWLNLDSEIESNNNKGKYLVKLKVGMHEFK